LNQTKSLKDQLIDGFLFTLALLIFLGAVVIFVAWITDLFGIGPAGQPMPQPFHAIVLPPAPFFNNYLFGL
jgi:hypothetical protein